MSFGASRASAVPVRALTQGSRRLAFWLLLLAAPLLPHVSSSAFTFPAVSNFGALVAFAALMLVPFMDVRRLRRQPHLDLLITVALVVPLGLEHPPRQWPILVTYPLLAYLAARMFAIARIRGGERATATERSAPLFLPVSWLVLGIAVLALVHTSWALGSHITSDVSSGGVSGAVNLIGGHAIYGAQHGSALAADAHTDTYGPVNYEAYVPFAALVGARAAAHLTTLFFDLLTALLLFALGRRMIDKRTGVILAYCWLAFPLTLYEDAMGFNDAIVAASVVLVMLASWWPVRHGAAAALAGWTKLSPLALVPLLAGHTRRTRDRLMFLLSFALVSALLFVPVLAHSGLSTFISRTFGFQAGRAPSESLWATLQFSYAAKAGWLVTVTKLAHAVLTVAIATLTLLMFRLPRRMDVTGLAAASAAIMIAVELCLSYYSYSYVLWFAPLVLVALLAPVDRTLEPDSRQCR